MTPFNGRLFAPAGTPLAERRDLDDEAARRALLALTTRPAADGGGRERIAYRDLGVEQLGTVYETLLDYEPNRAPPNRRQAPAAQYDVSLERGSGVRKATGTFYTPQPIADYLVRRTLGPLVRDAPPEQILALRIVDPAMGSGAFLVAACRYLARRVRSVARRSRADATPSDIGEHERAAIRRTIAERCLYGVDLNPMAVQLARLSLWLATLAADRPLTFLDHHLQAGDSLLGAWLSTLSRSRPVAPVAPAPARLGDASAVRCRTTIEARAQGRAADPVFARVDSERHARSTSGPRNRRSPGSIDAIPGLSQWKQVADLWCACWLAPAAAEIPPAAFDALSDVILPGAGALPSSRRRTLSGRRRRDRARRGVSFTGSSSSRRCSSMPAAAGLENAGFDAVIGNPPWDMIRADAGPPTRASGREPTIAPVLRFARDAGVYTAQSSGHANRYQLFAERALALTRRGGRLGLVLPSGLATDHGSARAAPPAVLARATSTPSSGSTTSAASFPSIAASGSCC